VLVILDGEQTEDYATTKQADFDGHVRHESEQKIPSATQNGERGSPKVPGDMRQPVTEPSITWLSPMGNVVWVNYRSCGRILKTYV
jgi:hypothetical protein